MKTGKETVNGQTENQSSYLRNGVYAGLLCCLVSAPVLAQDSRVSAMRLISDDPVSSQPSQFRPTPLLPGQFAPLAFDLAGSDVQKLELQLSRSLNLQAISGSRWLNVGGGTLMAGASLEWMTAGNWSLGTSIQQSTSNIEFQPVGSIHCQNGILQAGSYRASDCYFVDDSNDLNLGTISIGADYQISNHAMAAINLFRQEATFDARGSKTPGSPAISPVLDHGLLGPVISNPLLPRFGNGQGLKYLNTEVTGIDLEFKLGVSTDNAGDMQFGMQFTHVLDGSYQGLYPSQNGLSNWNIAKPFDSAKIRFDWQKNSFSGGVQGMYREPVDFLNRSSLDGVTTFDVYFTWRAPWNASLSVGASNLLNSGVDDSGTNENVITDPFEAVYGRIPYVRYQQDL